MKFKIYLTLILLGLSFQSKAQTPGFQARFDIPVRGDSLLSMPWIGGLNACLFGRMDLNNDGINDWVVYDKMGPRLLCFETQKTPSGSNLIYRPLWNTHFPPIDSWFLLKDYDGDGKPDLFTFNGSAGIRVYSNRSDAQGVRFELLTHALKAKLFQNYDPLYCSSVDYPALVDIDHDGDLDLLTFWVPSAGNRLHYYKNHSIEKYGHADSFDLIIEDRAWGCFEESDASNGLRLNVCEDTPQNHVQSLPKHTGSTLYVCDLNNDSLYDLLLGDFGFPNMMALFNHGQADKALITHYDSLFPRLSTAVNIYNCPALSAVDIDDDGDTELIFSPFNTIDFGIDGFESIWVYKRMGSSDYQLIEKRFLQDRMLDFGLGSSPCISDIDGDGLLDLLVGTYGKIDSSTWHNGAWVPKHSGQLYYLRNIGTSTEPAFKLIDDDFGQLSALSLAGLTPTMGDIDNDGRQELLVGTAGGQLLLLRYNEVSRAYCIQDTQILPKPIGTFLAPHLFDFDQDGQLDLILGEKQSIWTSETGKRQFKGNLNYFKARIQGSQIRWDLISDSLGNVDIGNRNHSNFGYAKPAFFKDPSQTLWAYCGNDYGEIQRFKVVSTDPNTPFENIGLLYLESDQRPLRTAYHSAPAIADLNGDGFPDMILGSINGGLMYFEGMITENPLIKKPEQDALNLRLFPNPAQDHVTIEWDGPKTAHYRVIDIGGRCVASGNLQTPFQLSTHGWTNGVYVLSLSADGIQSHARLIIQTSRP